MAVQMARLGAEVRIFDPDYKSRLQQPQIAERVQRNLDLIKERGLILDFNLAGFDKLASEPYPSRTNFRNGQKGVGVSLKP